MSKFYFIEKKNQQNETNRISDCTFWNRYVFLIFVGLLNKKILQNVFKVQKKYGKVAVQIICE